MIDLHNMTVLIVDDMINMCKSIHNMIRVLGYGKNVFYAENGKDALNILGKESIDLILMDFNMPGMTGGEALGHIREDRELKYIPVIMVTAEAFREHVAEAAESDADAYIIKPLTIKLLDDKISFVIKRANAPPPMVAHLRKAEHFEDTGDLDSAIKEAELAHEAKPESSRPIREVGYYHYRKNDLEEAEKWFLRAAEMNYMDVFAFHYLGELYLKQDNIEKAQQYFEKAMDISPRHLDRGIRFGKVLIQRKMVDKAIGVFNKALGLSGSTLAMREEIADLCIENEIYEYAVKLLEFIVKQQPDRKDLLLKLGATLESLDEINRALLYLVRAEKLDEEDMDIKIHLAKSYLAIEKPILAEKALKKVLKSDPDHEVAKTLYKQCAA